MILRTRFRRRPAPGRRSLLILAAALLLVACRNSPPVDCDDPAGCLFLAAGEPIEIAALLTLSGETAFMGQDTLRGVELAIADHDGRLLDHPIRLTTVDAGCTRGGGETALATVREMRNVVGLIGTNCSASAQAIVDEVSQAGLLMISPSNTAPALTDPARDWRPGYYRTIHDHRLQAQMAARYAYQELGARTAAVIYERRPYAVDLQQTFAATFQGLGGTVTFQGVLDADDANLPTMLNSISAEGTDAIYFPLFEPQANSVVAETAARPAFAETIRLSADSLFTDSFPESSGLSASGVYLTGYAFAGPRYDAFESRMIARYPSPLATNFAPFAYDATLLLLNAVEEAGQLEVGGSLLIGRQALRDALTATRDFPGVTGLLSCSPTGDCASETAVGVYRLSRTEIEAGQWPPPVVWRPGS